MKWVMTLAFALFAIYILLGIVLYVAQRQLIYLPEPYTQTLYPELTLTIDGNDITVLCLNTDEQCNPLGNRAVLYFGGNAEPVVNSASLLQQLLPKDTAVYLMNYRGYGTSQGEPSETVLTRDAVTVYDAIVNLLNTQANASTVQTSLNFEKVRIDVIGRSIGTGVACALASQRDVHKLALITPFDSLQAVAQAKFPLYPLAWLLKDTFRSDERASQIDSDTLLLVAGNDQLIPPKHASQLQSAFTQLVHSELIANATHNDIMTYPNAQQHLKAFLQ